MKISAALPWYLCGLLIMGTATGCFNRVKKLEAPNFSPATAAKEAMQLYDADSNGQLSKAELAKVPGILDRIERYDVNNDKQVSEQELTDRLQRFLDSKLGMLAYSCIVTVRGRAVNGAEVEFVPEPFLGEIFKPAHGITDESGRAEMALYIDDMPEGIGAAIGVQFGIFKIKVTHPTLEIPAKYNTDTELGIEISPIDLQDNQFTAVDLKLR